MKVVSKGTVAYVVAFALLLSWAFFVTSDTRRVDGHSMLPTLEGGDVQAPKIAQAVLMIRTLDPVRLPSEA